MQNLILNMNPITEKALKIQQGLTDQFSGCYELLYRQLKNSKSVIKLCSSISIIKLCDWVFKLSIYEPLTPLGIMLWCGVSTCAMVAWCAYFPGGSSLRHSLLCRLMAFEDCALSIPLCASLFSFSIGSRSISD